MDILKANQKTYEYVFEYFSKKIVSGELKLNDKILPERDIAEELGVSRNSVREVMHMLEITGLIECIQGSGNYVRCSPQDYMMKSVHMVMSLLQINYIEIFHIRCAYEYKALELAIDTATNEDLNELHQIANKMACPLSIKESAEYDTQFHKTLVCASHNRLLILYASMISDLLDQFIVNLRSKILEDKKRAELLQNAHLSIYEALVQKDLAYGRAAMQRHFEIVEEQLIKIENRIKNNS